MVTRSIPVEVSRARERGFTLRRQFISEPRREVSPLEAAAAVAGLHAARLSSPWVAMRARNGAFEPAELRRPLLQERSLVKLRCVRRTLHILPLSLAATAHAATLDQRLPPCRLALRRLGHSERALARAAESIRESLSGCTVGYRQLEDEIERRHPRLAGIARLAIKWLWERGEIVYVDLSPSLHHEQRAFALTTERYPGFELRRDACALAQEELALTHIRCFGPVSMTDVAWWSGMGVGRVRAILGRRSSELSRVRVRGLPSELIIHQADLDELRQAEPVHPDDIALLSYEDPSLKGYFDTRSRYVSPTGYPMLFNSIGEARASIMRGDRIVGIWTWNRRLRRVEPQLFASVPRKLQRRLRERLDDVEGFLRGEPVMATGAG